MHHKPTGRIWLVLGALSAAVAVALGAFGAHGLPAMIGDSVADPAKNLQTWETAARYQMYHSLALLLIGSVSNQSGRQKFLDRAGILFVLGIGLFSGMLYGLAITDLSSLGAIVPAGGLAWIAGWLTLAIGWWRESNPNNGSDIS